VSIRVVFMGSPEFAVPTLEALVSRPELVQVTGVVTQPDKPAGRGQRLAAPLVKTAASRHGLTVEQPAKMRAPETLAALGALGPELIVVAAYGRILPPAILALPRLGCINVHASLLPRHRGASPIAHAILAGDAETGVSIMRMEEGLDTGPVYGRRALPIAPDDTAQTLAEKLAPLGAELLLELLPPILDGRLIPEPQPASGVTLAGLLAKENGWLDFGRPARELERRVRAMNPWPLAFAMRSGQRVQVLAAHLADTQGPAGRVLRAGKEGIVVACAAGALVLDTVKPAGRPAMSGAAWSAGRGISTGDSFDREPPRV
jgi:methionyl-tRNA formyltransferase